ncbi:signal transduction histidine kinase [Gracilibacillus halotolerans]|uniref:histidine kinase n=1 Tax=Gracilibacillus halotolerans TaxID=74386 RepID=A0A841RLC9_9BACI|nr:sensor histidine kinase [Gracilibacillus halotolerans]MBB6513289.1 signal transduction histidine kinase [Gracilibacillus halotolerans]
MIKIRTKLLIYFATILLLFVLLLLIREQNNQQVMNLYDENMEHFFLLNELTRQTNETVESLQIYVHEPLDENLILYEEDLTDLIQLKETFEQREEEGIPKKNFLSMLDSFLEQTDMTVEGVQQQNIEQYSTYFNEVEITSNYIYENTLELINMELTAYQELSDLINQKVAYTKQTGITIIIAIIALSVLFALWFSNGITRPIERLTWAAQEIAAGRYSGKDVVVSKKDELWFLTKTFNEMKKNILNSVSEIEEKARLTNLLKEMELKSLQNQINPHFLFNTLNTISKTAYIEGAERTSDLISSVSALLRYNIGNLDRETQLKDEVEIVREYFFIQKTRFGNRVEFIENIDPACLSTVIPCMTLQPIVENAFKHGIENMASGSKIELNIYEKHDKVCIDVKDNGVGMDQESIKRLMNPKEDTMSGTKEGSGHSTGIGMRNVMDRLKLFQKDSKINISSEVGKGTTISIQINK